jgi:ABC-2 type transport system ATP-binding protein
LISLQNITKKYEGQLALDEVSFSVQQGRIMGLLGPNGAGKTSLLRIMTRILLPDSGRVLFDEIPLADKHLPNIGYLPEERGLYPKMQAREHLVFLGALRKLPRNIIQDQIKHWGDKLEITELLKRKIENLSKGQQQKVQLIAALLHDPSFIILDEPFSGFDPVNAELLKNILLQLKNEGKTLLISTHRMENAEELCDDIVMLNKGKMVLNGSVDHLLKHQTSHTFLVGSTSEIRSTDLFEVLGKQGKETKIRPIYMTEPNHYLQQLSQQTQVISFRPEQKTLKELFLEHV